MHIYLKDIPDKYDPHSTSDLKWWSHSLFKRQLPPTRTSTGTRWVVIWDQLVI